MFQTLHFVVVPAGVAAAMIFDAIFIFVRSIKLGIQRSLFCNVTGCLVKCPSFDCDCEWNVGVCTFVGTFDQALRCLRYVTVSVLGMRALVSVFVLLRLFILVMNILFLMDKVLLHFFLVVPVYYFFNFLSRFVNAYIRL